MNYEIKDLVYGGRFHDQFWNKDYNPNADIENGLANCTTFVIGSCLVENDPYPVSHISSASNWHNNLINDWTYIPFDPNLIKVGDIIQWVSKCHVAKVSHIRDGKIYINGSFYAGDHGVAYYQGGYDTRSFTSLKQLSDFMSEKYPERFYHNWSLEKEINMVGGQPDHILVRPNTINPVDEDPTKNQVQCLDNTLRIRTGPSLNDKIVGHVSIGYYNVLNIKEASEEDKNKEPELKCWYEISKDRWIANITTKYHEATGEDVLKELEKYFNAMRSQIKAVTQENKDMKEDMMKIKNITERWLA